MPTGSFGCVSGRVLPTCQPRITLVAMETISLKLHPRQIEMLRAKAKATGRSQGALVRELIDRHLGGPQVSLHDLAEDLCGSVSGREDTSTRPLTEYGRD